MSPPTGALAAAGLLLPVLAGVVDVGWRSSRWVAWLVAAELALLALCGPLAMAGALSTVVVASSVGGGVVFALTPWSGFWLLLAEAMFLLVGLAFRSQGRPGGLFVSLGWLGLSTAAFLAARTPLALVLAWGVLALAVYGLVVVEARGRAAIDAAWVMLVLTEIGSAALLVGALLLHSPALGQATGTVTGAAAILGVVGLGSKAGLFPFQIWLPLAEPEAPGAAAGLLSGVMTAVALVGMWQWLVWAPPAWALGWLLVALGVVGALLGVIHAVLDDDHKRVLAYSTVEWVGTAVTVLGLSVVFRTARMTFAAGLTEDAFFTLLLMHLGAKTAAFAASGWVERATGTRDLNAVGGLFRSGGGLSRWLILAVAALMAMPPTGGYLAEWLAIESVLMAAGSHLGYAMLWLAAPLALIAATGATAMLRWYGAIFLGPVRTAPKAGPSPAETAVTAAGAAVAWAAGVGAGWILPRVHLFAPRLMGLDTPSPMAPTFTHPGATAVLNGLGGRIFAGLPGTPGVVVFPAGGFTATAPWDLLWFGGAVVGLVALGRTWWLRRGPGVRRAKPWTGGAPYVADNAWSADGIAHPLRLAFAPVIRLRRTRSRTEAGAVRVETDAVDRMVEEVFWPLLSALARLATRLRRLQSGRLGDYVGFMLGFTVLALVLIRLLLH